MSLCKKNFQVFIISYKRAGKVTSDKVFQNAYVVIPKSQEEEYKKYDLKNECEYLVIPDEGDGNIARKQNYILRNYRGNVVIVDDDYSYIGLYEGMKLKKLNCDEIDTFIEKGFILAEDLGTTLWGLNMNTDKMTYREYSPFSMLSPILGPFQAHLNRGEFLYDERLFLKNDYDMSLQVLRKYHKLLRLNKFHYSVDHIKRAGGSSTHRTWEKEQEHNRRLEKKWGSNIVRLREDSINPIVKIPLKGI